MSKKTSAEKISDALNVDPPEADRSQKWSNQKKSSVSRKIRDRRSWQGLPHGKQITDIVNVGAGAIEGPRCRPREIIQEHTRFHRWSRVLQMNKDLIDLHKQMGDIEGESSPQHEHHEQFYFRRFDKAVTRFGEE